MPGSTTHWVTTPNFIGFYSLGLIQVVTFYSHCTKQIMDTKQLTFNPDGAILCGSGSLP